MPSISNNIDNEWSSLPTSPDPHREANLFETALSNSEYNRYANILALEETRVKLSNNEYINANFVEIVPQYKCIATQAPLPNCFDNFWRMILENEVNIIVMLTRLNEGGKLKANCYWPTEANLPVVSTDSEITVNFLQEVQVAPNTTVRHLEIVDKNIKKQVRHIHFTGWPDFGVPESFKEILKILEMVLESPGVPVVHCSAGVGRAGTFLALLNYQQLQKNEKKMSVSEIVGTMRSQRPGAVQTKDQFRFIYSVIHHSEKKSSKKSLLRRFLGRFF